jgi:spore coat protein U-like protein
MAARTFERIHGQWRRGSRGAAWLLLLLLAATGAHAAADCTVATVGVAFGTYDPASATPDDVAGSVTVVCTHVSGGASRLAYTVALSTGSSGGYAPRQLSAGSLRLNYNLFTNLARSQVWGNGLGGTGVGSGTFTVGPGTGNGRREVVHPVYGRIPAQQDALPGNYADAIVVTLTF